MKTNAFTPSRAAFEVSDQPVEEHATQLPEAEVQHQEALEQEAALADFRNHDGWKLIRATFEDKIRELRSPVIGDKPDYELIGKNYVVAQEVIIHLEQIMTAVEEAYDRVQAQRRERQSGS